MYILTCNLCGENVVTHVAFAVYAQHPVVSLKYFPDVVGFKLATVMVEVLRTHTRSLVAADTGLWAMAYLTTDSPNNSRMVGEAGGSEGCAACCT